MDEPQIQEVSPPPKDSSRESQFPRWSGILLMIAILFVAGIVSALTAMRFAIRGREVVVPELIGKTQGEADKIIADSGLVMRISSKRFSEDVPEGQVLAQIPPEGTRLKTNRTVRVLLSLGGRKFPVPNLVGTSLRTAQLSLDQRRLSLGSTLYAHTPEGEPGTVAYQSPRPGTQEGADPSVNILISLGPSVEYYIMPDLIGQPAEMVSSRARTEGFQIGKMTFRRYPGVPRGVVIQQKPQAGHRLSKSDIILMEVSQ